MRWLLIFCMLVCHVADAKPRKNSPPATKVASERKSPSKPEPKSLAPIASDFTDVPMAETAATHVLIVEECQGRILMARQPDELMSPSSMTKILTAYTVLDILQKDKRFNVETVVKVSRNANQQEGSKLFIAAGENIAMGKLLEGLTIVSGNDAGTALAESLVGSESVFAQHMTKVAHSLGATHTTCLNASGLPAEGHQTTCHDLLIITRTLMKDFPEHYALNAVEKLTHNGIEQPNRNPLLGWPLYPCDGVKTGYTDKGGYGMVGSCLSEPMAAGKSPWRLLMVINGLSSKKARFDEARKLATWAFQNFTSVSLPFRIHIPTKLASGTSAIVGADIRVVLPKGQTAKIEITRPSYLKGAQVVGTPVGVVRITSPAWKAPTELPLIVMQDVPQANWVKRLWGRFLLLFAKAPQIMTITNDLPLE